MAKNKDKIKVSFCGESSQGVTGSCYHIETENQQYLIECGLYQSVKSIWENYKINTRKFKFKAKNIDAIFVGHCHIDHMGLIPMLYAHHCTAPIYIPKGNIELFRILLEDCAFINERDAEALSVQRGKYYPPIYTLDDVNTCMKYVHEIDFEETLSVDEQTTVKFVGSGHILNAAQLILKIKNNNVVKTIGYTSDLGNIVVNNAYVSDFEPIKNADILIGESTYANCPDRLRQRDRMKDFEKLETVIRQTCVDNYGRVLIPCFASSRTQSMITYLYDIFGNDPTFDIPVLIDSPMACKITRLYEQLLNGEELEHYKKVLSWDNLVFVEDVEDSRVWRDCNMPCVVCSASGMLTAGRSIGWLGKLLPRSNNYIVFVGYIPTEGGIGIKIKEGKYKTLSISGKRVANRCNIVSLKSFSSHMQYTELLDYYSSVNAQKIILVHGEQNAKIEFAKILQEQISKNNSTARVICATKEYTVTV